MPRAREAADDLLRSAGAASDYGVIALDAWRSAPVFAELLAPVGRVACALLGAPRAVAFQDLVIDKRPGEGVALPFHMDGTYLPLDRDDGVVAWVALDDADEERGCLHYVRGSHRLERPDEAAFGGLDVGAADAVPAPAAAGEAWFHTTTTWHGSPPNRGAGPRRAWSVWFVREEARWDPARAQHPYLLRFAPAAGDPLDPAEFPRVGAN